MTDRGLACVWGHVLDTKVIERLLQRRRVWAQDDWTTDAALYVGMQVILSLGDYMNVQCHACIGGKSIGEDIRRLDYGVQVRTLFLCMLCPLFSGRVCLVLYLSICQEAPVGSVCLTTVRRLSSIQHESNSSVDTHRWCRARPAACTT
jgi:hypothetical protein